MREINEVARSVLEKQPAAKGMTPNRVAADSAMKSASGRPARDSTSMSLRARPADRAVIMLTVCSPPRDTAIPRF